MLKFVINISALKAELDASVFPETVRTRLAIQVGNHRKFDTIEAPGLRPAWNFSEYTEYEDSGVSHSTTENIKITAHVKHLDGKVLYLNWNRRLRHLKTGPIYQAMFTADGGRNKISFEAEYFQFSKVNMTIGDFALSCLMASIGQEDYKVKVSLERFTSSELDDIFHRSGNNTSIEDTNGQPFLKPLPRPLCVALPSVLDLQDRETSHKSFVKLAYETHMKDLMNLKLLFTILCKDDTTFEEFYVAIGSVFPIKDNFRVNWRATAKKSSSLGLSGCILFDHMPIYVQMVPVPRPDDKPRTKRPAQELKQGHSYSLFSSSARTRAVERIILIDPETEWEPFSPYTYHPCEWRQLIGQHHQRSQRSSTVTTESSPERPNTN